MTLLMIEGWETRTLKNGWATQSASYTTGRFGGSSFSGLAAGNYFTLPSPQDTVVVGQALLFNVVPGTRLAIGAHSPSGMEWSARFRSDRYLELLRGSTVLATSVGPGGNAGEWIYVEVKGRTNDVTGFIEARINGVVVCSYAGDTSNNAGQTVITMLENGATGNHPMDDLYVLNTVGPAPFNDYLGEISIETLVPNGNGVTNQFVGSDGNSTDNYLLVDELPAVDTDHAASSTVGQRDLYTFTDPAAGVGEVLAVQVNVASSKLYAGPANYKVVERLSSGVERVSGAKTTSNLLTRSELNVTDPSGAAWLPTTVANMQFGVEIA